MLNFDTVLATPEQANELQMFVNQGYGKEITRIPGSLRYPEIGEVISLIQNTHWLVVLDPGRSNKIIGSLMIESDEENRHKMNAFAIDVAYRGKGLSQALLRSAEKYLVEKGVTEMFLDVISVAHQSLDNYQDFTREEDMISSEENPLARYYQKLGFAFTGNVVFTPYEWQAEYRKTEYVTRVYFREMRKQLT